MRSSGRLVGGLALIAALLLLAVMLQRAREALVPAQAASADVLYVTSGNAVRRMSVAYQALAADLYWIRAIQHFGGTRRQVFTPEAPGGVAASGGQPYALLYPLLDLTTTLDPRFNIAYRFGSIFLAE